MGTGAVHQASAAAGVAVHDGTHSETAYATASVVYDTLAAARVATVRAFADTVLAPQ